MNWSQANYKSFLFSFGLLAVANKRFQFLIGTVLLSRTKSAFGSEVPFQFLIGTVLLLQNRKEPLNYGKGFQFLIGTVLLKVKSKNSVGTGSIVSIPYRYGITY